ncbi:MAG: hypothetical protein KAX46_00130 [Chromatiaceae bacterium]|nr:hypothetical protein [Chromatiaceae bacterium]
MLLDERTEFADAAAIALNIGNAIAPNTDVIDLGATPTLRDLGGGERLYLVLQVDTTFVGAGATIQFQLASDSTANLATSRTNHIDTGAIALATWAAGYTKVIPLPTEATYERYLGLWMTVATANVTAGKLNAFLTNQAPAQYAYPDAI